MSADKSLRRALLLLLGAAAVGVDHAKFRTCQQTGFCRRRRTADTHHPYVVAPGSLSLDAATGAVRGRLHGGPFGVSLTLDVLAYVGGTARLRVALSAAHTLDDVSALTRALARAGVL